MQQWQVIPLVSNKPWDSDTFAILTMADLDTLTIVLTLVVIDTLGPVPLVVEGLGFVWTVDGDL